MLWFVVILRPCVLWVYWYSLEEAAITIPRWHRCKPLSCAGKMTTCHNKTQQGVVRMYNSWRVRYPIYTTKTSGNITICSFILMCLDVNRLANPAIHLFHIPPCTIFQQKYYSSAEDEWLWIFLPLWIHYIFVVVNKMHNWMFCFMSDS